MKKILTFFLATFLIFNISAQTCTTFNANIVKETYQTETTINYVETHIIVDQFENALKFVQGNEDWFETIESIDTVFENRIRIIQLWTASSYWEIRQYRMGNTKVWQSHNITEYPYFGQTDRRLYRREERQTK